MARRGGAVHVSTSTRIYHGKVYTTHLLRRTYREDGKVKHETLGNISHLPEDVIALIRAALKGEDFTAVGGDFVIERSLAHGHVLAVLATMRKLGIDQLLASRRSTQRELTLAMIAARVIQPASKLATTRWWQDTTLLMELDIDPDDATAEACYETLDWLLDRQVSIESKLVKRHLTGGDLVLYDLTSTYFEGSTCPLANYGYSRDGKRGTLQITIGLVTDREGRPLAVEVFDGSTLDEKTLLGQVHKLRDRFGIEYLVIVGDRGTITRTRIEELSKLEKVGWISALRAKEIQSLQAKGLFQPSLFDQRGWCEISSEDHPGERLVVCRNPLVAAERERKREVLLSVTEKRLQKIADWVTKGRLENKDKIALRVGKVLGRSKVAKHFELEIEQGRFVFNRRTDRIETESRGDGFYVIRAKVKPTQMDSAELVRSYKRLSSVERAFRSMKGADLELRPIYHHLEDRVRAHVLLCMLAYYVVWHLRKALAPLLFAEEDLEKQRQERDPVAPAKSSTQRRRKAETRTTGDGLEVHSWSTLIAHLGSLQKNRCRYVGDQTVPSFWKNTQATDLQRRVFDLLEVSINT